MKIYVAVSSSRGAHDKGKTVWNSLYHQNWWFSEFHPNSPLSAKVLFCRFFFESHTGYDQTQRVLVLCLSCFTDSFIRNQFLNVFTYSLIKFPNGNAHLKLAAWWYKPSSNSTAVLLPKLFIIFFFCVQTANRNGVHSSSSVVEESEESASASSSLCIASLVHQ